MPGAYHRQPLGVSDGAIDNFTFYVFYSRNHSLLSGLLLHEGHRVLFGELPAPHERDLALKYYT